MPFRKKTLKLYYTDHSANKDKEYHVIMEADESGAKYFVYGMNGRRGRATTKQDKSKTAIRFGQAQALFNDVVEDKRKGGYTTNISGQPHAGISTHLAVEEGNVGPVLQPITWLDNLTASKFDEILELDDTVIQELPPGTRLLLEVGSSGIRQFENAKASTWTLPFNLQVELSKAFTGWVVDTLYDPVNQHLTLVDGYAMEGSGLFETATAPFHRRIQALTRKAANASPAVIDPPVLYRNDDKYELVSGLQNRPGKQILMHNATSTYDPAANEFAVAYKF